MTKAKEPKSPRPRRAGPTRPANPTTSSFQVSDALWEVLAPLIPKRVNTHPLGGGRPRVPDRTCANGIFYVLRTGCQWKALDLRAFAPARRPICAFRNGPPPGSSCGFGRWDWNVMTLDWNWLSMDGAITKSPLGGGKNRSQPHGPG